MLAAASVVSHCINNLPVKVRATDVPTVALGVGAKQERSFRRAYEQKRVALLDLCVSHAVKDRRSRCALLGAGIGGDDGSRLNGFEGGLYFTRALITLRRFLGQAALDDRPQTRRHWRSEQAGRFAHDRGADFKPGAPFKGNAS